MSSSPWSCLWPGDSIVRAWAMRPVPAVITRAHYVLVQNPDDMGFFFSVNYLIFWVFGGSYTFWGPVFGAMFLTILPECLRFSLYDRFIIYGVILTAIVIVRLQGVITRVPLGRRPAFVEWLSRLWRRPVPASKPG